MNRTLFLSLFALAAHTAFGQQTKPAPNGIPPKPQHHIPAQRAGNPTLKPGEVVSVTSAPGTGLDSQQLDAYIQKNMAAWQIPGLAIAIVKDGRTVYMKGFGTRVAGKQEPVDTNTLFLIASNTKLFTGTALSNLVQRRRLNLDDKVTQYFPDFRLYDSVSTRLVSVRDMLTHRIGTKTFQGDFTYLDGTLTRAQIMEKMRYMKPSRPFRQDYGYCNSCYLVAGQVVEKVTGKPWEAYITDSILKPLRMTRTTALSNDAPTRQNIAKPYTTLYTGQLKEVPYDQWDNLGPAASILSNVADMTHWLKFQLDSGRYEGRQVMPWATLQRTRDVQIALGSRKSSMIPQHYAGYGLGVQMSDFNGRQVYRHTGGAVGMLSSVSFVPEERLGIVILTNQDNQDFFDLLRVHLLSQYLNVPDAPDYSAKALEGARKEMKEQMDSIAVWRARVARQAKLRMMPPAPAEGVYRNAQYGTVTVKKIAKSHDVEVSFEHHPTLKARLAWMGGEQWLTEYNIIEYGIYPGTVKTDGRPSLTLTVNPFLEMDAYTFVKE